MTLDKPDHSTMGTVQAESKPRQDVIVVYVDGHFAGVYQAFPGESGSPELWLESQNPDGTPAWPLPDPPKE